MEKFGQEAPESRTEGQSELKHKQTMDKLELTLNSAPPILESSGKEPTVHSEAWLPPHKSA